MEQRVPERGVKQREGRDGWDQDEVLRALDRQGWTSGGCQSAGLITCWLQGTSEQSQWPRSSSVKSNIWEMTITALQPDFSRGICREKMKWSGDCHDVFPDQSCPHISRESMVNPPT